MFSPRLYRLFWAVVLLFVSTVGGALMYRWIEGWNWLDSFYMSVITAGTVGFQEVHPLSTEGRIFTVFFIIFNLAIFTYFASVITSYLIEGELRDIFKQYLTKRKVEKFTQHVIICGFGRNGFRAAEELLKNDVPFVVVETKSELIEANLLNLGKKQTHLFSYIEGDATQDHILHQAGIKRAKALLTTLPKDADNVFVTLTARQLNKDLLIIARANEASTGNKLLHAGANRLVRPDVIGGTYMANLVMRPEVVDFLDIMNGSGKLKLEEFSFDDFKLEYRNIKIEILKQPNIQAHIIAFKDNLKGFLINPNPDTILGQDDTIIVLGTQMQIFAFAEEYTHKFRG